MAAPEGEAAAVQSSWTCLLSPNYPHTPLINTIVNEDVRSVSEDLIAPEPPAPPAPQAPAAPQPGQEETGGDWRGLVAIGEGQWGPGQGGASSPVPPSPGTAAGGGVLGGRRLAMARGCG